MCVGGCTDGGLVLSTHYLCVHHNLQSNKMARLHADIMMLEGHVHTIRYCEAAGTIHWYT